jgi:hypothetical protein
MTFSEQTLFHTGDDYFDVEAAIRNGHLDYARERLRDVLQENPDAEAWYLLSFAAASPPQRIHFLEQALALNPHHLRAQAALERTRQSLLSPSERATWIGRLRDVLRRRMA